MESTTIIILASFVLPLIGVFLGAWYRHSDSAKVKKYLSIVIETIEGAPKGTSEEMKKLVEHRMAKKGIEPAFNKEVKKVTK